MLGHNSLSHADHADFRGLFAMGMLNGHLAAIQSILKEQELKG